MTILITGANRYLGNELKNIVGEGTSELGVLPLFYAQSKVVPVDIPVRRPAYSTLDNSHLRATIGDRMRDWKVALDSFMEKYLIMERMQ